MNEVQLLKKLGLTEYESRVLLALVYLGPATAREIVNYSKVPKNKTYEVLPKLEEKNLVVTLPISPKKYKVENLEKLKLVVNTRREELDVLEKSIVQFQENLSNRRVKEYKEFFWVIRGQRNIQEKLRIHNEKANNEVLTINRLSHNLPQNMRVIKEAVRRGVDTRMICLVDKSNVENVKRWKRTGAKMRVYNKKKFGEMMPRFTVFDAKTVRITIGKPEITNPDDYLSLLTDSPALAQLFRHHFLILWEHALPLEKELKKYG